MKRLITLLVIVTMTIFANSIAFAEFSDVSASHENYDAIMYVQSEGIVDGYEDGTYKPDDTINRAEFTKIIIGAQYDMDVIDQYSTTPENIPKDGGSNIFFADISMMDWFAKYVGVAKEFGIIEGYPGGFFKPYGKVTFSEASKMIVLGLYGDSDLAPGSPWYKPYVDVLGDANAIPTTIGFFDQEITRGEMAEMIYRLKEAITSKPFTNYNEIAEGTQTGYATSEDEAEAAQTVLDFIDYTITELYNEVAAKELLSYELQTEFNTPTGLRTARYGIQDGPNHFNIKEVNSYEYDIEVQVEGAYDQGDSVFWLFTLREINNKWVITDFIRPGVGLPTFEVTSHMHGGGNLTNHEATAPFYIEGTTSDNCSKIVVEAENEPAGIYDNYTLSQYSYGDTTFKYGVNFDWGNLGEGNITYYLTAYCDNMYGHQEAVTLHQQVGIYYGLQ